MKSIQKWIVRVLFLVLCLGGFLYGLLGEGHMLHSLTGPGSTRLSGPGLTEVATYDGALLKDGKLYDVFSIMALGIRSNENGEIISGAADADDSTKTKDCKT